FSFLWRVILTETNNLVQPSALLEVHLGDNVTLECSFPEEETNYIHYMYWFKFIIGQTPQLIAASHKYTEEATLSENFNSGRFKVKLGTGINHLIISRTESSDSAMYYCATRSDYTIQFGPGTLLRIKAMFYNNFNSTRMKVLADVEINHLIISETKPMDSAMYYCGVLKNYDMIFGEGTFLIVRGKNAFFQNYVSVNIILADISNSNSIHKAELFKMVINNEYFSCKKKKLNNRHNINSSVLTNYYFRLLFFGRIFFFINHVEFFCSY
uniref:Immunoglobulin domain-containing protein n=1 Tax=Scleropages formosus TaxID=113540 RepID=A0A8C9VEY7_SCLFO